MQYNFSQIEKKWRKHWQENPFQKEDENKPKFYCLDMFPYPSSEGIHVGHWRGYVISDVLSRYKILQGYQVLHPMGWDAFGLPAENFAIKSGIHPAEATKRSVTNFKRQIQEISAVYNWEREISTTDPEFYKWTQWIFVKMFEKGLAYEKEMPLNWCPSCKCVLANEEAVGGECERCGATVTKKMLRQWMLKITEYGERLLQDLSKLDWPEKVKKMQSDWIGKSYGAEVDFSIENSGSATAEADFSTENNASAAIKIYTTRPDTLYGATFMVLAPEHPLVSELTITEKKEEMERYVFAASTKSSIDRMSDKEKTGVFTGSYSINPLNGRKTPIWVSDYVLSDYGTGAIMCVPAHDERDFEFAEKFNLPIIEVISPDGSCAEKLTEAYTGEGVLVNSGPFDGLSSTEAIETVTNYLQEQNIGKKTTNYKLRDWVFSRQRYWGEPIPIIHCEDCGPVAVPVEDLPVLLPNVESYKPTETGESPLSAITDWVSTTCPHCHKPAKRETNTMPQWAGSSWYFLRYADPRNHEELASKESLRKWLPVDYYVGGVEHAVLHLLYARFYTKFLYDIGAVDFDEPFIKLFNQGMINKNGMKMSKSKGNSVSPDDLVARYGCDSLRIYELFVGPPEQESDWDDSGIDGVYRYLNKTWKLIYENKDHLIPPTKELERLRHKMIYEITTRLNNFTLNTVVSGFMECTNKLIDLTRQLNGIDKDTLDTLITLLAPFAPHMAEELWELTGHKDSIFLQSWPRYDAEKMKEDVLEIAVQLNGKLRQSIRVPADADKEAVLNAAKESLGAKLEQTKIVREIYVPGRIVNFVVK